MQEGMWEAFLDWVYENNSVIVSIVFIIIITWAVTRFADIIIARSVKRFVKSHLHPNKEEEKKREETIIGIMSGFLKVIAWPISGIIIVSQLGVDVAPLIAGAGIVGIALGFGAQTLVKDSIAGLFILAENQYRVGDVVKLDDTSGMVEHISLRRTVLRDLDGIVHHVPNGSIEVASNFTSEQSGINLDIPVSYDSDINKAIKIINQVGESIAKDEKWKELIIETPTFLRVDSFGENAIFLKVTGTVAPLTQWDVTGELRKCLKEAFDKNGIEMPLPQVVVRQYNTDKPSRR